MLSNVGDIFSSLLYTVAKKPIQKEMNLRAFALQHACNLHSERFIPSFSFFGGGCLVLLEVMNRLRSLSGTHSLLLR